MLWVHSYRCRFSSSLIYTVAPLLHDWLLMRRIMQPPSRLVFSAFFLPTTCATTGLRLTHVLAGFISVTTPHYIERPYSLSGTRYVTCDESPLFVHVFRGTSYNNSRAEQETWGPPRYNVSQVQRYFSASTAWYGLSTARLQLVLPGAS